MANKTIEELKSEAAVIRDATEEGENTATRVGNALIDMIDTLSESVSINAIKGYVVIDSTSELPANPTAEQQQKGYLLDTMLYVYVGSGGDTLDGKYQSAELKGADGADGEQGPQGPQGESGVSLGDVAIADNCTTNDATKVLSAKQGYNLYHDGFYFMPQLFAGGDMATNVWANSQYCTTAVADGVLTLTPNNTGTAANMRKTSLNIDKDHKYYVQYTLKCTIDVTITIRFTDGSRVEDTLTGGADWKTISGIIQADTSAANKALFCYFGGLKKVESETRYAQAKEVSVIDLTAVFGAGNEPTADEMDILVGSTWQSTYKANTDKVLDMLRHRKVADINMDVWFPLESGNYTPVTAIAALPSGYGVKGLRIRFKEAEGNRVVMTYLIDDPSLTAQSTMSNWALEADVESAGVNGGSVTFPTTDGYYLPADSDNVVGNGDWYIELFAESLVSTATAKNILVNKRTSTTVTYLFRLHQGQLQGSLDASNLCIQVSLTALMNGPHHVFVSKSGSTFTTYVDGVQACQYTDVAAVTNLTYLGAFENLSYFKTYMLRIGKGATDYQAQMLEHWNNGDVMGYECNEADMVMELKGFGTTYMQEHVRGCVLELSSGSVVSTAPYEQEIWAAGAPSAHPQFTGQRYFDTTNKRYYRAIGYSNLSDWKAYATKDEVDAKQNALVSGTTIKTINGTSILGAGNMQIGEGGGGGSSNVVNVVDYGATGTGATDDTTAIMQALEVARVSRLPLYFPANGGNCTYLTRKGLVLTTGMKVTADKGAILKNASAVLDDASGNAGTGVCAVTTLTANAAQGAHSVVVASTAGLAVGQEVTIINSNCPSYQETLADITAISGTTVTFDTSRFTASGDDEGVLYALTSGAYLTTDFSLIKTCIGKPAVDIEIENITLQACGNTNEPYIYTISPINQTRQAGTPDNAQKRIYIRDVTIDGSAQDGISTQGQSDVWIEDCIIKDVKYKGIHYGTSCDRVIIRGNYIYNCGVNVSDDGSKNGGAGAIYFCVNNHRVLIENNNIENCRRGVFGFDYRGYGETDTDSIISGNTFTNCTLYGLYLLGGYRIIVNGNNFREFTGDAVPISVVNEGSGLLASVISNNVIGGFKNGYTNTSGAIAIANANQLAVNGNVIQANGSASGSFDIIVTSGTKVALVGNVVGGSVDISDVGNSGCIAQNNIES